MANPHLYLAVTGHVYAGLCPDETQPLSHDEECPACRLLMQAQRHDTLRAVLVAVPTLDPHTVRSDEAYDINQLGLTVLQLHRHAHMNSYALEKLLPFMERANATETAVRSRMEAIVKRAFPYASDAENAPFVNQLVEAALGPTGVPNGWKFQRCDLEGVERVAVTAPDGTLAIADSESRGIPDRVFFRLAKTLMTGKEDHA